jgi:hypothetical protein
VLVGRCLAYGEGTTLGALADLVRGLGRFPRRRVEELLADDEPALRAVLSAVGLSDEPVRAEETSWAMRRLLQRLARDHPLVVAVEDIHWAEPALLDQLDHVVALASGSPILLLCLTRPELLENPAGVGRATAHRFVVVLDALADEEALELAGHPNEAVGYGAFAIGERVVVVGAATHDLSSYPTPYLWEGTFTVEDENQPSSLPGIRGRDVDTPDPASLAPTS